ncbi:hypothetical protein FISHEDRAFT_55186 [Fistulina hepatica ATCC 64428]|uniref:Uncharacterized protein n=1 Tax=Fistulina hepatica ATCC 64428 TaxID=1128425 RepID=A0A0D7AQ56_9AGAR|nr:hypothetical protein FISHEDRAFT_55186 [Fistulina hepatica ATCC 64428]
MSAILSVWSEEISRNGNDRRHPTQLRVLAKARFKAHRAVSRARRICSATGGPRAVLKGQTGLARVKSYTEELADLNTPTVRMVARRTSSSLLLKRDLRCGKNFLVDMFYDSVPILYKARKHYGQPVFQARCPVLDMRSDVDWRSVKAAASVSERRTWCGPAGKSRFNALVRDLTYGHDIESEARDQALTVFGRTLRVPWACEAVGARKDPFADLCQKMSAKNEPQRFISLIIDPLHEARCGLICIADGASQDIFFPDSKDSGSEDVDVLMAGSVLN